MATRAPKEKRRNSEKRKEKSREAARCRRSKESEIFTDMANLLPVPASLSSQLDKASIMRLTIAFLKAQSLLGNSVQELCSMWNEEKCSMADACWPQALGGMLLALSSEGDIIYLTENVTQQLGLPQMDLIGQSIYDYCHPCDHDELREVLSLRPDGDLTRSFFLRLKSTITAKGRSNNNLKAASYKVMNCSGRIVLATASVRNGYSQERAFDEEDDLLTEDDLELEAKAPTSHFLVMVGDPIPHPSNIEMPLDSYTFLTKHTLDMKYSYVDEKIYEFLGYTPEDLEGQSAYQLHHAQDNESVLKSYKTMFTKGQIQTPPYRFLARHGGYAWIQTQATLVYGNRDSRPQAVVCVHTCLSEIEDGDQILFANQAETSTISLAHRPLVAAPGPSRKPPTDWVPQNMTSKLFVPKTAEMNEGFLIFDKQNGATVLKEEPEDLTHLAPVAGDTCIPLDMPSVSFPSDLFDVEQLTPEFFDCLPLTGFDIPLLMESEQWIASDGSGAIEPVDFCVPPVIKQEDPFIFFNSETPLPSSSSNVSSPLASSSPDKEDYEIDYRMTVTSPSFMDDTFMACSALKSSKSPLEEEDELDRRAPYISMNESDDLPLFDPSELFCGLDLECLPLLPMQKTGLTFSETDQCVLVKLLQQNDLPKPVGGPPKLAECRPPVVKESSPPETVAASFLASQHAHKRSSLGPADDSNPKRLKAPTLKIPSAGPLATRVVPLKPSRGATSSLMELLIERPTERSKQSSSVLQNLLVSGHDLQTGHELQKRHSSCKAVSSSSSCFVSLLPPPQLSLEKVQQPFLKKQLLMEQQDQFYGDRFDSSSDAGSDTDTKVRHPGAFSSLNNFPFNMDASPCSSVSLDIDADFFDTLNMSGEFVATDGATE
ncbi:hypoxia-inducible factor 1-alpha-like isoform X2 [Daphnia carinata]|uniref:hypoxia-inducible factor 1-alpha-like isoform X2 n=1 Tax=Daphnia carinata TaxID=120202 RepID=UPI00257C72B4|nr:hypoxia-inducible factor 1-alpha-like isoform X2 [Daphnia carinata]